MHFSYGWPRVLDLTASGVSRTTLDEAAPAEPAGDVEAGRVVQLLADDTLLVVITAAGIQIWSGGQHRVRLGCSARSGGAVRAEGAYKRAFWSSPRRLLAVVVNRALGARH